MAAFSELFPLEPLAIRGLVSERDLMDALKLSRTTLWRLRSRGMPTVTVGRSVRYDLRRVRAWLEDHRDTNSATRLGEGRSVREDDSLPDCHWQLSVALDPKHRPQEPTRPASTVRREWWRYPQEAHLVDRGGARYRRLIADEIRALQGFPEGWGSQVTKDELLLIRGYGDAVPPQLAEQVFATLPTLADGEPLKTSVEVCAGFGGMALGKSSALPGLTHLALFDHWSLACEVLRSSAEFPTQAVRELDLNDFDWSEFAGRVDVLSGGPPCQPWSVAGQGLGEEDHRDLLGKMPEVVAAVRPRVFVFENVPGLLSGENEPYARRLIERLRNCAGTDSYGVAMGVLNAADFGVPQTRRRVFIVGAVGKSTAAVHSFFDDVHSRRTHAEPRIAAALKLRPWITLGQAIPDWESPRTQWRRWPQPAPGSEEVDQVFAVSKDSFPTKIARRRVRVGLDWPSRGLKARFDCEAGWQVEERKDDLFTASLVPLLATADDTSPDSDPWYVSGEPMTALESLRRVVGRRVKFVYLDVPRIKTNAGTFEAADREALLDTWLTVVQGLLRRAFGLLDDDGVIAALSGIEETHFVRLLMDEIAGPGNHIGTVAWQKNYSPRNMPGMKETSPTHDNIVVFARRMESLPPVALKVPPDGFANQDGDPRGPWNAEQKGANKPDCDYDVNICPYRWSIAAGELPPGIWRINPKSGVIWAHRGDLKDAGEWRFTVRVEDREGQTAEKKFKLRISADATQPRLASIPWLESTSGLDKSGRLRIETHALPDAKLGAEYSACLVAAGGSPWVGTTRPGKKSTGGKGRYWEFPLSTLVSRAAVDAVDFKSKNDAIPAPKTYLDGAQFTYLNQTSVWLGGSKNVAADVGYSQDAKKELEDLVKAGVLKNTIGISKPAALMARLLALFSNRDGFVVDLGSPAAEMASVATAMGRRAIYVEVGATAEERESLLKPRLEFAASGRHALPKAVGFLNSQDEDSVEGYLVDGSPRRKGKGRVYDLRNGAPFALPDTQTGTAAIDYGHYPAGSELFLQGLASLEGLVSDAHLGKSVVGRSVDGRVIAVYAGSSKLEQRWVEEIEKRFATQLAEDTKLRIYYHRGSPPVSDEIQGVEYRRIPFELNFMAGMA